jgi:hypothetical protein
MSAAVSDDYAAIAEFYDSVPLYSERPDVTFYVDMATTRCRMDHLRRAPVVALA